MTVFAYLLGVLLFVFGLAVSVGLHEFGHLIFGKIFNVKVTQFMVGFGRTIWSKQIGETEYGLKWIPLGGYCKLVGMVPPDNGHQSSTDKVESRATGMFAQLVDDARDAEYEHVEPEDQGRLFYQQAAWKRICIMGAGVVMNLALAFVLYATVFMGYGVNMPTTTVSHVSKCVIAVTATNPERGCIASDPQSPAAAAGFKSGDKVLSFNGKAVSSWSQLQGEIRANGAKAATVVVERDGRQVTLHPTTVVSAMVDPNNPTKVTKTGFLGIGPEFVTQRQGVGYVVSTMTDGVKQAAETIATMPNKIYHVARATIGLEKRDEYGPISVVGAGRMAGEMVSTDQAPIGARLAGVTALLASLNLFLGMINLVPLPPFDGGGIATTAYEAIRRRLAPLLGRPDPGAVDSARMLPITYAMAMVIVVMSVILIVADIVAPVSFS